MIFSFIGHLWLLSSPYSRFVMESINRSLVVAAFLSFKWPFTLQFEGWPNDLENFSLLDHFRSFSSNSYLASFSVITLAFVQRTKWKNSLGKLCSSSIFTFEQENFKAFHSMQTLLSLLHFASIHSMLSFTDKLDSTRTENFLHKSTSVHNLFSYRCSPLNIYQRRYSTGSIQSNPSRKTVLSSSQEKTFVSFSSYFFMHLTWFEKAFRLLCKNL